MNIVETMWNEKAVEWSQLASNTETYWAQRLTRIARKASELSIRKGDALDIGCGPGLLCELVGKAGFTPYGADISEQMIERSIRRTGYSSSHFQHCSGEDVPFIDHRFSLITAIGVLEYITGRRDYIRQLSDMVEPGGLLVVANTNNRSMFGMLAVFSRLLRYPFDPSPEAWNKMKYLWNTGIWSGGHLDHDKADNIYSARKLDAMLLENGFRLVDAIDLFNFRVLDQSRLTESQAGKKLARLFGWNHIGFYRHEA